VCQFWVAGSGAEASPAAQKKTGGANGADAAGTAEELEISIGSGGYKSGLHKGDNANWTPAEPLLLLTTTSREAPHQLAGVDCGNGCELSILEGTGKKKESTCHSSLADDAHISTAQARSADLQ